MISLTVASPDDLTDPEMDTLRMLRFQTADGALVERPVTCGLAEWTPTDSDYRVARLTSAGRELAEAEE